MTGRALALVGALSLAACATPAAPTFTLLGVDAMGEGFALDTGQTLADCERETFAYDVRFIEKVCVAEPA